MAAPRRCIWRCAASSRSCSRRTTPVDTPRASTLAACASSPATSPRCRLSVASMEIWERIARPRRRRLRLRGHGQVLVAESEAELADFRARVDDLRLRGFTHEELIDRGGAEAPASPPCPSTAPAASSRGATAPPIPSAPRRPSGARPIALGAAILEGVTVTELDAPRRRLAGRHHGGRVRGADDRQRRRRLGRSHRRRSSASRCRSR